MLRSMNSAISGMQAFEQQLDVVGNNIANVNTTGFKAGSTEFEDMLSQNMGSGSQPQMTTPPPASTPILGGTNPIQIGLGVKVAAIDTNFTQGADQTTGVTTNVAINGTGLFTVSQDNGKNLLYTREGDFSLDSQGNLVLPNGAVAMGVMAYTGAVATVPGTIATAPATGQQVNLNNYFANYAAGKPLGGGVTLSASPALTIGTDGSLTVTDSAGNRDMIGYLALMTPPNPSGLAKVGGSLYQTSANSGTPVYQTAGTNNSGTIQAGALEASNVDLTVEFSNMIVAQRGFDANSHMIGTDNAILNDIVNLKNG